MDRKKRKHKNLAKVKHQLFKISKELDDVYQKYNIPGVEKIALSGQTQLEIGCTVGEIFSIEEPWNYVEKYRILDTLDEHENSSEFLNIKKLIEDYSEEKILMGYEKSLENDREEYFICTTVSAKNKIKTILEKEEQQKRKLTKKHLSKFIKKWYSFGSEIDVEDSMLRSFRPLYVVEINSDYPIAQAQRNFNFRLVQDSNSGYVECTTERFSFTNIYRKRIDSATQVTSGLVATEVQTNFVLLINSATQYEYLYDDNLLGRDLELIENLRFFLRRHRTYVIDSIKLNNTINFYLNDYQKYAHDIRRDNICSAEALFSVNNVVGCKDMTVTCVSWHPMISGILAVAYAQIEVCSKDAIFSVSINTSPENLEYIVLIWNYWNQLKPVLTLITYAAVTKLSFCPHDGNVLIGGCKNGQIVLWDLTDKLQLFNNVISFPNNKLQRIKIGTHVDMNWWKNTIDDFKLHPTAVSNINYGHLSTICDITWISPDYKINSQGRFSKSKQYSKQFVSSCSDSLLLFWSLNLKKRLYDKPDSMNPKMARRIQLFGVGSPYKILNLVLRPIFKIVLHTEKKSKGCFLQNVLVPVFNIQYVPSNPETQSDFIKHTFFKPKLLQNGPEVERNIVITTKEGTIAHVEWEGYDFDPGLIVNFENRQYFESKTVHDGPIRTCLRHNVLKDVLLTVGGRVFAVWNEHDKMKPIMWRKCLVRYVSGIWSPQNTCDVFIARQDSCFEVWNLYEQTKMPIKIIRCPGNLLVDIYGESDKRHVRKGTFVVANTRGQIKLYLVPNIEIDISEDSKQNAEKHFDIFKAKQDYLKRIISISKDIPQRIIEEDLLPQSVDTNKVIKKSKPEEKTESFYQLHKHKYTQREEKQMYELMLKKKSINLAELEAKREPIRLMYEEKRMKADKLEIIKIHQQEIFKSARHVMVLRDKRATRRKHVHLIVPTANISHAKKIYIEDYQDMEPSILRFIRINNYSFKFNWYEKITSCIERWKLEHSKN